MAQNIENKRVPSKPAHLWRRFLILIPLTIVLTIITFMYCRSVGGTNTYVTVQSYNQPIRADDILVDVPNIVEITSVEQDEQGCAHVSLRSVNNGDTMLHIGEGDQEELLFISVKHGIVFIEDSEFVGWESVVVLVCALIAVAAALFASVFVQLWRTSWYGYDMVASNGGFIFCMFQLLSFAYFALSSQITDLIGFIVLLISMTGEFIVTAQIPLAVMAVLVSASNIALIRHEGMHPVNLLGVAVSVFWIIAIAIWSASFELNTDLFGTDMLLVILTLASCAVAYGEALLLSTIVCAWLASRHVPKHQTDYLIILGCGIRADGTPTPLLAGRVDRAYAFDETRIACGDAPATFVPSGGKGADEVISEAESMARYLADKGVSRERIAPETRSATTHENMAFSREVIEAHAGRDIREVSVAFSTTNYHVFRGYVYAHEAGMSAEGMGSKTRAYFWPNAFLREFVGLLAARWKSILLTYAVIAVGYCAVIFTLC